MQAGDRGEPRYDRESPPFISVLVLILLNGMLVACHKTLHRRRLTVLFVIE